MIFFESLAVSGIALDITNGFFSLFFFKIVLRCLRHIKEFIMGRDDDDDTE